MRKARRGRPPSSPSGPKRASFNTRITQALKDKLSKASSSAGRSISEEVERRLEQSFERDHWLELMFRSRHFADILESMAKRAWRIEQRMGKRADTDLATSRAIQALWLRSVQTMAEGPAVPAAGTLPALLERIGPIRDAYRDEDVTDRSQLDKINDRIDEMADAVRWIETEEAAMGEARYQTAVAEFQKTKARK
jgi:hypothetical protein